MLSRPWSSSKSPGIYSGLAIEATTNRGQGWSLGTTSVATVSLIQPRITDPPFSILNCFSSQHSAGAISMACSVLRQLREKASGNDLGSP